MKKCTLFVILLAFVAQSFSQDFKISVANSKRFAVMKLSESKYTEWKQTPFGFIEPAVTENLYTQFDDDFDFIFFILNEDKIPDSYSYYGCCYPIKSVAEGIGGEPFDFCSYYGSQKLQALMDLSFKNAIFNGPTLHEIMHIWGNYVFNTIGFENEPYGINGGSHWGVMGGSSKGQLGGFAQVDLQKNVDGDPTKYRLPYFGLHANGGNGVPYNDFELYLAGMLPLESVADFDVFQKITSYEMDKFTGEFTFFSNDVKTYTPAVIKQELGERKPSYANSQKEFKTLFVVVSDHNLSAEENEFFDKQIERFCLRGDDQTTLYNFWEATRGVGSINPEGIDKSLKKTPNGGITAILNNENSISVIDEKFYFPTGQLATQLQKGGVYIVVRLLSNGKTETEVVKIE